VPRIRSVTKAVHILLYVAEAPDGVTAKETSDARGLPVATAYHLLDTLVAEGMLVKDSRRRYHLGPRIGVLSDAFLRHPTPPEYLIAPLRRLAEETGETTYLSGWQHDDIAVLASVEGSQAVAVKGLYVGFAGHAHARASGKLFLAFARPEARDRYLQHHELLPRTPHTITNVDVLRDELGRIAERGVSFDEQEFRIGVTGCSAPVVVDGVVIAAYTVSAPTDRFAANRDAFVAAVTAAARSALDHASTSPP
jgi:IclR family acetate operon transcriptional repressor